MTLTYAIGDIHGSLDKLRALFARCEAHAAGRPSKLVFLGDYIDRGADSFGVIDFLLTLRKRRRDDVVTLMGNHEEMALSVIDGENPAAGWLVQGGAETLASYDAVEPDDLARDHGSHVDWMRALRLSHDDGRRLFVHAGVNPDVPLDAQSPDDLLWIREPFLSDRRDYGRLIVHGHTPLETGLPELHGNRVNLDTAAVFGGPLTAAVFDDTQTEPLGFLQAK
jgi:serine/threonine protein phosphatase 1